MSFKKPTFDEVVAHAHSRSEVVESWPEWKKRDLKFFDGGRPQEEETPTKRRVWVVQLSGYHARYVFFLSEEKARAFAADHIDPYVWSAELEDGEEL